MTLKITESPPKSESRLLIDAHDEATLKIKTLKDSWDRRKDVDKLKELPQRKWNEFAGAWFVPLTDLNIEFLFENWNDKTDFTFTDAGQLLLDYYVKTRLVADKHLDVRLQFLKDKTTPPVKDYFWSMKPFDHQKIAFASGRNAEFFALLMEMGTGKTKVTIDIICDRVRRKTNGKKQFKALIVAPKSICHNWVLEFGKHGIVDMNVEILRGGAITRVETLLRLVKDKDSELLVAICNYDGLKAIQEPLKKMNFDIVAFDESIWVKNPSSKRSKASVEVARECKSVFILTGLPITKNILDLYAQFDVMGPGLLGFTSFNAYRAYYSETNQYGNLENLKKEKIPQLQERLSRFSFSIRREQCIDLPAKQYQELICEFGDDQKQAYVDMATKFLVDFQTDPRYRSEKNVSSASIILVKLLRLSQITSGFIQSDDKSITKWFNPNPKFELVKEIMQDLDETDKVIIWSCFRPDIIMLKEKLTELGYNPVTFFGGMKDHEREHAITKFSTDASCKVFIGNQQSGGFGINLTEANRVIYYSNNYSLQHRKQSEDRCHRIGQTRSVVYFDLTFENTVDDIILDTIKYKKELSDLLTNRDSIIGALSRQINKLS